jgi:hypothetical protein
VVSSSPDRRPTVPPSSCAIGLPGCGARLAATAIGIERSLDLARRGLVPFWAKDIKVGFANINAKAEGIENQPSATHSSGAAALSRSITSMSGRRPRPASNPSRSRSPTADW